MFISKLHKRICLEIPRTWFHQWKNSVPKEEGWFELQKNLNSLQLCALCTAAYDKNRNKPNYGAWQALFNAAKMS